MSICIALGGEGAVLEMQNDDGNYDVSVHQNISFLMRKYKFSVFNFNEIIIL